MKMNFEELKRLTGLGQKSNEPPAPSKVGKVFVLDGTNVVGHRVVERLVKGGYAENVRVGMGDENKVPWEGVEEVKFRWEKEETYADALKGMKTVFITTPSGYKDFDKHFPPFLTACHNAKVKRIVKLSFFHSMQSRAENPRRYFGDPEYKYSHDGFHEVPLVHKHALCDGDLILKGLDCTILFASHLMSNVLTYQGKILTKDKKFYGASNGKGVNYVSPNDCAEIAYLAILHPKAHKREGISLLGPAPITDADVAKLLSTTFGTEIAYEEKPLDFFDRDSAGLERIKASGLEEDEKFPKGDFKRIAGRDPESFEAYLAATDCMCPLELSAFPDTTVAADSAPENGEQEAAKETTAEEEKKENVNAKEVCEEETPAAEDEIVEAEEDVVETKLTPATTEEQTPVASQ